LTRGLIITLGATFAAAAADLISKWYVVSWLDLQNRLAIDVLPPVLNFRFGMNEGINFGLFQNGSDIWRYVLVLFAIGVSVWAITWAARRADRLSWISAGLLAGGALGNAWDRFFIGAVRDFLNMSCCGINNPYVFNIADIAVFAGVIGLIYVLEIRKT